MKRFLALVAMFFALTVSLSASGVKEPKGFSGDIWKSTMALYGTHKSTTHFLCTAEIIGKIDGGYRLLSAGHCVKDESLPTDLTFSVSHEVGGTRTPVMVEKAYLAAGLDFSVFDWKTSEVLPVSQLGSENDVTVGDKTVNVNFAMGVGKQLAYGRVLSAELPVSEECEVGDCAGYFLVQQAAAPGASGSAIYSEKTHKIIGLLIFEFNKGQMGFAIEPISWFQKFMDMKIEAPAAAIIISPEYFAQNFGEAHPFMLTVHGANPVFTQAGYQFRVETDGFELDDPYYYDVPVLIVQDDQGGYRLQSTKEPFSVGLTVLAKVATK